MARPPVSIAAAPGGSDQVDRSAGRTSVQRGRALSYAIVVLLTMLAAAPLWGPGIINTRGGGDSPFLLQRTLELADNLAHGVFPPRWMSHAAYDLGYPFFHHYAALPYYISGGLAALGLNPLSAIQITQTLGFLAAGLAMFLWSHCLFRRRAAQLLAVAAYTFAPFHLVNVYVRGDSLSEFYAFIWYPLILWSLDRVTRRPSVARIATAAFGYAALILTHNVSALIFTPFALAYGVLVAVRRGPTGRTPVWSWLLRTPLLPTLAAVLLGILLSAWFWLPAILETDYVQMGPEFTAGYFHYSNHFRGIGGIRDCVGGRDRVSGRNHVVRLVQRTLSFDYNITPTTGSPGNDGVRSPFSMGSVQAALALVGVITIMMWTMRSTAHLGGRLQPTRSLQRRTMDKATALALVAGLALATLMVTPLSRPLWDWLPLLNLTQFPWRFLSIQALFAAACIGATGERVSLGARPRRPRVATDGDCVGDDAQPRRTSGLGRWVDVTAALSILLLVAAAMANLKPERLPIGSEDVTWDRLRLYESFTGNIGTTIRYEYLPRDVVPRLYTSEALVDGRDRVDGGVGSVIADSGQAVTAHLLERRPNRQTWAIHLAKGPERLSFPLNWWPGWRASIDGAHADCGPISGSGRLTLTVPAGSHTVSLRLQPTPLRFASGLVSLASIALLTIIAIGSDDLRPSWRRIATRVGIGALLTALCSIGPIALQRVAAPDARPVGTASATATASAAATFFDFEVMPYPHRGPILYGDGVLSSAIVNGSPVTVARAGDIVSVVLGWQPAPTVPVTATLALVSPALPRHGVDYVLAASSVPISRATHLALTMPEDLSRGRYLLMLTVHSEHGQLTPRTSAGRTMGDLFVGSVTTPVGPPLSPEATALAAFEDLVLHAMTADHLAPTTLRVRMVWSTDSTPRNWRLSLRVTDVTGRLLVQQDHQPGYGYLPTTLWQRGQRVTDYGYLELPEGLAPGEYRLQLITYLQATMAGGGQFEIPIALTEPTLYDIRDSCCEHTRKGATILCQTDGVALLGLQLPESVVEGEDLTIETEWNALQSPGANLVARWSLHASDGAVIADLDQPPAVGSDTSGWPRFTWATAPVTLDLPDVVSSGEYQLHLTLEGGTAQRVACGVLAEVAVRARLRVFDAPEVTIPQETVFDDLIQLLGYDVTANRQEAQVVLTLWWQSLAPTQRDLKRFVHLYDPGTETIVSQDDAMPRDWAYPTTWWLPGEVVSETVTLDTAAVASGRYRLAVGWYDPETLVRLPVTLNEGATVRIDRADLRDPVVLR